MLNFSLFEKAIVKAYTPLSGDNPLIKSLNDNLKEGSNFNGFFDGLYKFGIAVAVALAIVMIIVGGIQYMTTDAINDKGEGRKKIQGAFIGLLIAVSSFAILYTINPDILNTSLDLKNIEVTLENRVQTTQEMIDEYNKIAEMLGLEKINGDNTDPLIEYLESGGQIANQQELLARKYLEENGIVTNNTIDNPNRTLVAGLVPSTVDGLLDIKNATVGQNGRLVLTAGNEGGHAQGQMSHSNGYKFDLGKNSNINNWTEISEFVRRSTGQTNLEYNKTYSGLIPGSGQRYDVRLEDGGGEHFDFKIYPHDSR